MRIIEIGHDFYEIQDGDKWWTASKTRDGWYIMSSGLREIKPNGKLGRKILEAIKESKK
jgi:hypothetical protein